MEQEKSAGQGRDAQICSAARQRALTFGGPVTLGEKATQAEAEIKVSHFLPGLHLLSALQDLDSNSHSRGEGDAGRKACH